MQTRSAILERFPLGGSHVPLLGIGVLFGVVANKVFDYPLSFSIALVFLPLLTGLLAYALCVSMQVNQRRDSFYPYDMAGCQKFHELTNLIEADCFNNKRKGYGTF